MSVFVLKKNGNKTVIGIACACAIMKLLPFAVLLLFL